MPKIELVEQTLRNGQQSLRGMRLRGGMLEAVASRMDRAGFRAIEVTGSSLMECSVRRTASTTPSLPISRERIAKQEGWSAEMRAKYGGPSLSDEELPLRYLVPMEDLEAARAAGPLQRTYDYADATSLRDLLDHLVTFGGRGASS